ncbi:DUF1080 domain-containing protein [candidate division KSB1 bacterium]
MKMSSICIKYLINSALVLCSCTTGEIEIEYVPGPYNVEQMYDENAPQPPVVTPSEDNVFAAPPSDAVVIFDGSDLNQWTGRNNSEPKWNLGNGYFETVDGTGDIFTKMEFGSCQLHVEWASPDEVAGSGQDRGNSGVYLMGLYEIQVLDSYKNNTYPPGMAASVYGQNPPLVNASRPPGEWQSYDIVFHRPVFENGKVIKPAEVTVFHNGVLVQDNFKMIGATVYKKAPQYTEHADKLPLMLQNHHNPVRFRNIWIREVQ